MPESRRPTRATKKLTWQLEIVYEFHPTDRHRAEHWMYCQVTGATPEECKENAKKYYEAQIRSVGWGKITTLKEIKPLTQASDPAKRKSNSDLSSSRGVGKSSDGKSTPRKRTPKAKGGASGDKDAGAGSEKPKRNRKASPAASGARKPKPTGGRGRTGKKRA